MQRLRGIVQIAFAVSVILLSQSADAFSRERFRLAEKVADARLDDPTGRSSEMLTGGEEDHAKKPGFILLVFEFIVNKTGFGVKDHDLQQAGSLSASSSSSSSEEEHGWLFGKREKHPIRIIVSNQTKASANLDPAQVQAQKELRDAQKLFPNRDFVYLIEISIVITVIIIILAFLVKPLRPTKPYPIPGPKGKLFSSYPVQHI